MNDDLCPECGESLWAPNPKAKPEHAGILLRWVHDHSGKKVRKIVKFLPVDWTMDDETSKIYGRTTPSQERAIQLALSQIGDSNGALIADEPGFGKTNIGAEFVVRSGFTYGLVIGLPNTHDQWFERIFAQSDGAIRVRIMNGTTEGRENYAAFLKRQPGIYVAGPHYLTEKDWKSEPQWAVKYNEATGEVTKTPLFKIIKATGMMELKERPAAEWEWMAHYDEEAVHESTEVATKPGMIGPAAEPVRVTKSRRLDTFGRFSRKPIEFIVFDEMQAIANRKSATRATVWSIKAGYRMGMSGTWMGNKVENQWSGSRWVWPGRGPDGEPYVETNHSLWKDRFLLSEDVRGKGGKVLETQRGTKLTRVTGERIPGEFVTTLPAYIRREAEPVPAPTIVRVDATPEQRAQIDDLQRDLMTWVMGWEGEEMPLVVDIPAVLAVRLRQVAIAELSYDAEGNVVFADNAKSAKLAPLRQLIEGPWAGQPVAIYTDSKIGAKFIERRMRAAGVDARAWTGDLTKKQRDELKASFLAGEFPYLISTVQSFGTGIDGFQWVCNKVVWVSQPQGDPGMEDQAIRRYFRPGMTNRDGGFQHAVLMMNDSSDETTLEMLLEKAWRVRTAMNGGQQAA